MRRTIVGFVAVLMLAMGGQARAVEVLWEPDGCHPTDACSELPPPRVAPGTPKQLPRTGAEEGLALIGLGLIGMGLVLRREGVQWKRS